jgi:hypothetical protein
MQAWKLGDVSALDGHSTEKWVCVCCFALIASNKDVLKLNFICH